MGSLQGQVIIHSVTAKSARIRAFRPVSRLFLQAAVGSATWGLNNNVLRNKERPFSGQNSIRLSKKTYRSLSPSSDGNMDGKIKDNDDEDYVDSSVIDAVVVKSSLDGFVVKMSDGSLIRCVHNYPQAGDVMEYAFHSAIVLKMEDKSGLLLPITVPEMSRNLLMEAVHNIHTARPTVYQVIGKMVDEMGYEVKLVRVTKRFQGTYFAKLFLQKIGNEHECISIDLRPSDAINIAVRCKVSIQVNRILAFKNGIKVIDSRMPLHTPSDGKLSVSELDRPYGQTCSVTKEFYLIQNMVTASVEERYEDAAHWRDKLIDIRSQKN